MIFRQGLVIKDDIRNSLKMNEQKQNDITCDAPEERLSHALKMIGVEDTDPKHFRSNIVLLIMLYAGAKGDSDLGTCCKEKLESINAE